MGEKNCQYIIPNAINTHMKCTLFFVVHEEKTHMQKKRREYI